MVLPSGNRLDVVQLFDKNRVVDDQLSIKLRPRPLKHHLFLSSHILNNLEGVDFSFVGTDEHSLSSECDFISVPCTRG